MIGTNTVLPHSRIGLLSKLPQNKQAPAYLIIGRGQSFSPSKVGAKRQIHRLATKQIYLNLSPEEVLREFREKW
jgi:hypothetical protein